MKKIKIGLDENSYLKLLRKSEDEGYKDFEQWIYHQLQDLIHYRYDPNKCQATTILGQQCGHPKAMKGLCMKHYKQTLSEKNEL